MPALLATGKGRKMPQKVFVNAAIRKELIAEEATTPYCAPLKQGRTFWAFINISRAYFIFWTMNV